MEQAIEDVVKGNGQVQIVGENIQLNVNCQVLAEREVVEGFGKICRKGEGCPDAMIHEQSEKGCTYLCLYDNLKR